MDKKYKAVRFTPSRRGGETSYDDIDVYDYPYEEKETRFCIIDTDTGEIVDDANGYGYKSPKKAYAGFSYKTRDKSKDKAKRAKRTHIVKWMDQHKSFVRTLNQYAFEIMKGSWGPDAKVDAKFVKELLDDNNLEVDFTPGELLRVWRNR